MPEPAFQSPTSIQQEETVAALARNIGVTNPKQSGVWRDRFDISQVPSNLQGQLANNASTMLACYEAQKKQKLDVSSAASVLQDFGFKCEAESGKIRFLGKETKKAGGLEYEVQLTSLPSEQKLVQEFRFMFPKPKELTQAQKDQLIAEANKRAELAAHDKLVNDTLAKYKGTPVKLEPSNPQYGEVPKTSEQQQPQAEKPKQQSSATTERNMYDDPMSMADNIIGDRKPKTTK